MSPEPQAGQGASNFSTRQWPKEETSTSRAPLPQTQGNDSFVFMRLNLPPLLDRLNAPDG